MKFEYVEAVRTKTLGNIVTDRLISDFGKQPTPQQKDGSSCGPMVVRNSALRMNGLSVGGWHDVLDPERLRMDIVEAFETCISEKALQQTRRARNSGQLSNESEQNDRMGSATGSDGPSTVSMNNSTKVGRYVTRGTKRLRV